MEGRDWVNEREFLEQDSLVDWLEGKITDRRKHGWGLIP